MARARQIERSISKGQLTTLIFTQTAVAASQSAVAIGVVPTAADVIEYTMPFDFEIIAVTTGLNQAQSAGSFTANVTINTTGQTGVSNVISTAVQRARATFQRGRAAGVAGDRVGVKVTTDSGWLPITSNDVVVTVWVLVHLDGI